MFNIQLLVELYKRGNEGWQGETEIVKEREREGEEKGEVEGKRGEERRERERQRERRIYVRRFWP
jgi:hypothetical protein